MGDVPDIQGGVISYRFHHYPIKKLNPLTGLKEKS
jgi:hypothetical protein